MESFTPQFFNAIELNKDTSRFSQMFLETVGSDLSLNRFVKRRSWADRLPVKSAVHTLALFLEVSFCSMAPGLMTI
jgi:hypothetical protein